MKSFIKWTLLFTGIMPLIYSAGSLFPYIFPKALYFRMLVMVAVVGFCGYIFFDKNFRDEMIQKIGFLWKNSIFKIMTLFYASLVVSTIFAFDRYMAMFGNIEREEGFVGLFFFYIFFVLATMLFQKKDWLRFFSISLFTGGVLFLNEMSQSLQGVSRPGSFTDNPIFLATYYLFTICCAVILWRVGRQRNNMTYMLLSTFSIIISVVGLFITETRGTILGMIAGLFVVMIYFGFSSENFKIGKNLNLRKLVIICLIVFGIFAGIFIATRKSGIWDNVPGLNRIALISSTDATTQARFVNGSIALHAVNPSEASITRSLFGWGWDNYIYAWQKFYNPKLFSYDMSLFDRAHDKVLDVLLMTGIVGFILYLGLWFSFFREAIKIGKKFSLITALCIFWGIAFFLQNLTVFDTQVTFITFYAMFAYLVYETTNTAN